MDGKRALDVQMNEDLNLNESDVSEEEEVYKPNA